MLHNLFLYWWKPTSDRAFFVFIEIVHGMSDRDLHDADDYIKSIQDNRKLRRENARTSE